MINVLDTTATFRNRYINFQINHKSRFTLVIDDGKEMIKVDSFG